jgi:hypothetical protein
MGATKKMAPRAANAGAVTPKIGASMCAQDTALPDRISAGQVWERTKGRHRGVQVRVEYFVVTDEAAHDWWVGASLSSAYMREYRDDELYRDFVLVSEGERS